MHVVSIIIGLLAARAGIKSINKYVIRPNALKMELKKYSNTDNIKILELPDDIYLDESKDNEVENNEVYKKVYESFCSTLTSYVPRTYLDNFYRNFKTITETETSAGFKFRRRITRGTLVYGSYNNLENEIDLGYVVNKFLSYFRNVNYIGNINTNNEVATTLLWAIIGRPIKVVRPRLIIYIS